MKKLFPLLFITILFSQTKEVIVDRYENGVKKSIIVYEGEGSSEKLIRKLGFYRNGKLQFSTDWKDGKKNGNVIVYYQNGELGFKGKYLNEKLDGNMVYYYTDGKIHLECKIQYHKDKTEIPLWVEEIEDDKERERILESFGWNDGILDFRDSSYVYLMNEIKIYDRNGKKYENIYESKKFDEIFNELDIGFIYESEIVDVLNTLTVFDYGFFRTVLKKD
jgi:antitoxin component YwqK of YwqJK toxin-antitoxin module